MSIKQLNFSLFSNAFKTLTGIIQINLFCRTSRCVGGVFVIIKADHVKILLFNSQTAFLLTLYQISVVMSSGFVTVVLIFLKSKNT